VVAKLLQVEGLSRRRIGSDNRGQFSCQAFFRQRSANAVGVGHDCQGVRFGRQARQHGAMECHLSPGGRFDLPHGLRGGVPFDLDVTVHEPEAIVLADDGLQVARAVGAEE
jgi:hypothetical protein